MSGHNHRLDLSMPGAVAPPKPELSMQQAVAMLWAQTLRAAVFQWSPLVAQMTPDQMITWFTENQVHHREALQPIAGYMRVVQLWSKDEFVAEVRMRRANGKIECGYTKEKSF
jgi:hypothetical protein